MRRKRRGFLSCPVVALTHIESLEHRLLLSASPHSAIAALALPATAAPASSPFAGSYVGSYSGDVVGPLAFVVDANGNVNANAGNVTLAGSVTPSGAFSDSATGTDSTYGSWQINGTGTIAFAPNGTAVASGTWTGTSSTRGSISGTWMATATVMLTITIPSGQTAFTINASPEPTMPTITANVQINGSDQNLATTQVQWTAQIDFSDPPIDTSTTFTATAAGGSITFDKTVWGDKFRGGDLTLSAAATVDGQQISATLSGLTIAGQNPDTKTVLLHLAKQQPPRSWPTNTSYSYAQVLDAILDQETQGPPTPQNAGVALHYDQFNSSGMPIISVVDSGVGLMQITPPKGANIADPNDVWNWEANLDGGIAIFNSKLTSARTYVHFLRDELNQPNTPLYEAVLNAEQADGYDGLTISIPPMTPDEMVLDAIRGYNGFSGQDPYRKGKGLHEFELAKDSQGYLVLSNVDLITGTASLSWVETPAAARSAGNPNYVANVLGWYERL